MLDEIHGTGRFFRSRAARATLLALACTLVFVPALAPGAARAQEPRFERPPVEAGPRRAPDLVELVKLDRTIRLDVRYATADNFAGRPVYAEARAFLQRPAARALVRASRALRRRGYGLVVFDAYRPWRVTKLFWEITPEEKRQFVADPALGSKHNRGCAVDVTLYDLKTGRQVAMPSAYDDFTERAHSDYAGGTAEQRRHRSILRAAMEAAGFHVYAPEWWHFDYKDWRHYPILDIAFSEIAHRK